MQTELYWVGELPAGRLAIAPRPRGGDWLEDEIRGWRRHGVDVVVSLLTADEQADLDLADEEMTCRANDIEFVSFPITDREVPASAPSFSKLVADLGERLAGGKTVAVHCRQGLGRAALVAIGVLIAAGVGVETAITRVGAARGRTVPETPGQVRWLAEYAGALAPRLVP